MLKANAEKFFFQDMGWGHNPPTQAYVYSYTGEVPANTAPISVATNEFLQVVNGNFTKSHACFYDIDSNTAVLFLKEQISSNNFSFLYEINSAE